MVTNFNDEEKMMQTNKSNVGRETARFNMIEQQIRPWDVLDPTVLQCLRDVPRENFVAESQKRLAFVDVELPIGYGQTMLSPKLEARLLQALEIKKTDRVLLVGTGSGYLAALLATLAAHVTAVEIQPELSESAGLRLQQQKISNVTLQVGDALHGFSATTSYDVIVFAGSVRQRPIAMEKMLNQGGRLFVVVGEAPIMQALLVRCLGADVFRCDTLFETCLPPLVDLSQSTKFKF